MKYIILIVSCCLISVGAGGGLAVGQELQRRKDQTEMRSQAVALGCGQYNSKTGAFEFVRALEPVDVMQLAPLPTPKRKPTVTQ